MGILIFIYTYLGSSLKKKIIHTLLKINSDLNFYNFLCHWLLVKQKKIRNIFKILFVLKEPNSILLSKEHTSKIMKTYSSTGKKVKVFWDFFLHIFFIKGEN